MSRIDELIAKYCPNGVEHKTIADICDAVFAGGTPNTNRTDFYGGDIPWLRSGEVNFNQIYKTEKTITQKGLDGSSAKWIKPQSVLVAMTGATVARSAVNEIKLTANQSVCAMEVKPELVYYKFLYYIISNKYEEIKGMAQGALTSINLSIIKKIVVPVPPLAVQEEIVNILDSFSLLEAELEAELEARKKQYEHYRDELLNPENMKGDVNVVKLGEVMQINRGVRLVKSQLSENVGHPVFQNSLTPLGYYDRANCPANTPFVISAGAAGDIGYSNIPYWAADDCWYFSIDANILPRYLYFFLKHKQYVIKSMVRKASIPRLSKSIIERLEIPIPPLAEQERIVSMLDKFDALVNDISDGLPAEINARRQQYEYYRDKLLNFEPMAA